MALPEENNATSAFTLLISQLFLMYLSRVEHTILSSSHTAILKIKIPPHNIL